MWVVRGDQIVQVSSPFVFISFYFPLFSSPSMNASIAWDGAGVSPYVTRPLSFLRSSKLLILFSLLDVDTRRPRGGGT